MPTERHRATPSDTRNVTGGQGVAGSNPAAPTSNRYFSNILTPHKSQQKSQLVVQRPRHRPAPRACHGTPPGHAPRQNNRQAHQARRQRSLSHPGPALRPRTPSPAHPLTASRTVTGYGSCRTRACQGAQTRPAHAAADARRPASEPPPRTGRHDRSDLHRLPETRPHPRYGEVPSRPMRYTGKRVPDFKASGTANVFPQ